MKHTIEQHTHQCGCRSVGECMCNISAERKALIACVDDFAENMKKKLLQKMVEGKNGWEDPEWFEADRLAALEEHLEKSDMIDVANFAMFVWNNQS
ncbi:MAG: hypothetical protein RLO03_13845 [Balneola sp.]